MQMKLENCKFIVCFSFWSILMLSQTSRAAVSQSRSVRTSSDTTRPSGFGLDLFLAGDGAFISTSSQDSDESSKQGSLFGGKALVTLINRDLEIEGGAGYYKTLLQGEKDVVEGDTPDSRVRLENVKITTDTALVEFAGRFRLNEGRDGDAIWSIGPTASAFLGTNASFGPDSKKSYRSAIFLGGQLALTFGTAWKPRLVAQYLTDLNLYERQVHIGLLSLQFGGSLLTPMTIVKDVRTQTTDENIKKVTVEKPIERSVIKENVRFLLDSETVNFETNKATLLKRSDTFLRELGRMLAQYPDRWTYLTIEGHTDIRGSFDHNSKLSTERASSVRDALLRSGVPAGRMKAVGFGPTRPVDPGNNDIAWARNRRVELSFEGVKDARWLREVLQKLKLAVSSLPR
jgi:peptidoglycan-associated lipoprotein